METVVVWILLLWIGWVVLKKIWKLSVPAFYFLGRALRWVLVWGFTLGLFVWGLSDFVSLFAIFDHPVSQAILGAAGVYWAIRFFRKRTPT
jgi:hypothetical protein